MSNLKFYCFHNSKVEMHFKVRAQKYILIDEKERIQNLFLVLAMNYQVLIDTALVVVVVCTGSYLDSLPHILNHPEESFFIF